MTWQGVCDDCKRVTSRLTAISGSPGADDFTGLMFCPECFKKKSTGESKEHQFERLKSNSYAAVKGRLKERLNLIKDSFNVGEPNGCMSSEDMMLTVMTEEICQIYNRIQRIEKHLGFYDKQEKQSISTEGGD